MLRYLIRYRSIVSHTTTRLYNHTTYNKCTNIRYLSSNKDEAGDIVDDVLSQLGNAESSSNTTQSTVQYNNEDNKDKLAVIGDDENDDELYAVDELDDDDDIDDDDLDDDDDDNIEYYGMQHSAETLASPNESFLRDPQPIDYTEEDKRDAQRRIDLNIENDNKLIDDDDESDYPSDEHYYIAQFNKEQHHTLHSSNNNKNEKINKDNDEDNDTSDDPTINPTDSLVPDSPLQLPTYNVNYMNPQRVYDFDGMRREPGYVEQEETYEQYQQRLKDVVERYKSRGFDFDRYQNYLQYRDDRFFDHEHDYVTEDIDASPDYQRIAFLDSQSKLRQQLRIESSKLTLLFTHWDLVTDQRHNRRTKQGKLESYSSLIVGGDGNGLIGFGLGKALNIPDAQERAKLLVRKNLIFIPLFESRTISHRVTGKYKGTLVRLWPRGRGEGLLCHPGLVFNILTAAGIKDATCKIIKHGSHPRHQVYALFDAMSQSISMKQLALQKSMTPYQLAVPGGYTPRPPTWEEEQERSVHVSELLNTMIQTKLYAPIDDLQHAANTYQDDITKQRAPVDSTGQTRAAPKFDAAILKNAPSTMSKRVQIQNNIGMRTAYPRPAN